MKKLLSCVIVLGAVLAILAPGSLSAQAPVDARVLVWEKIEGSDDGRLQLMSTAGEVEVLVDFGGGVFDRVAKRCGQDYWAEEGQGAAIFTGAADSGELAIYPLAGGAPVSLGTVSRMACAGPETFQFAPNGQRVAFIDFEYDALEREFPTGDLLIYEAATGTLQGSFDWTTGFKLYDEGALMLRLFPDGKGNATEADFDWWDGAARQTLVTLEPIYPPDTEDVDCSLTSGSVARIGSMAYALVGQKCETGTSNWRVISVPIDGGDVTEIALGEPVGGFFSGSFTTQLIPARDGSGFLIAVPSGLTRNTTSLMWVTPDGTITPLLEGYHVLTDRVGDRLSEGRHMQVSRDGSVLAFVTVTPNQEQTLWLLDLSTTGSQPVMIEEEGGGQRIFQYLWSANNRLYYAAGSIESSSLHVATLGAEPQRMERGRFYRLAVSYTGDKIGAAEWYDNPDSIGDDLFKLTILTPNGINFTLQEGGENYTEFIPLALQ
jgi:hypothetical protein